MIKTFDLEDPSARKVLLEHAANTVLTSISSVMGSGFTAHDDIGQKRVIWNAVKLDLFQFEKLDKIIDALEVNLVMTGIRHFIRLKQNPHASFLLAEKDGICLRFIIETYPTPTLTIDYAGWR